MHWDKSSTALLVGAVVSVGFLYWATRPKPPDSELPPGWCRRTRGETGWTYEYPDGHWIQLTDDGLFYSDTPGSHPTCVKAD